MIHLTVQQLSASLDGSLAGPSLELVVRHLAVCHECRDRQARLAKHDDALRRMLAQEPSDMFLDDLTRRAESLVTAITRGVPAPVMVTSVPLLHEEDPYAPTEPPPLPPRPELGRSGELAKEAGWGRIGMKPTGSTQAPQSDPEEAQRMLEALASGSTDDFTELTAQGLAEHTHVDGPIFDLPAWIKDQSKRGGPPPKSTREVPRLNLFFEQLDDHAAGMTREAVNEVFRHDEPAEPLPFVEGSLAPELDTYDLPELDSLPPEHTAYAPPGWTPALVPREPAAPTAYEQDQVTAHNEYAAYAPNEWTAAPTPPPDPNDMGWNAQSLEPASLDPIAYAQAFAPTPDEYLRPDPIVATREPAPRGPDRALVLALVTVGGLLLVILALQLMPAPRHASPTAPHGVPGVRLPNPRGSSHNARRAPLERIRPHVHSSTTRAPLDQVLPPLAPIETPKDPAPTLPATEHVAATAKPHATAHPEEAHVTRPATPSPAETAPPPATHTSAPAAHASVTPTKPAASKPAVAEDTDWPLLCGQVVDDAGQPVVGARVSMAEISFATRTDARGRFCMSAPAGSHSLFVEASGFTPERASVTLTSSTPEVHLKLQPAR